MKKFKLLILLKIILLLSSCSSVKEGFSNQKKNNTDEFMVEKKSPLKMPPNYNELPEPKSDLSENIDNENQIEKLINKSDDAEANTDIEENVNKSFEELILDKIRNN